MSLRITLAPTQLVWFQRFMVGSHKWMGGVWILDMAVSRYIVRASLEVLEESWKEPGWNLDHQLGVAAATCIIINSYFAALFHEEMSKANIGTIHVFVLPGSSACTTFVVWTSQGPDQRESVLPTPGI